MCMPMGDSQLHGSSEPQLLSAPPRDTGRRRALSLLQMLELGGGQQLPIPSRCVDAFRGSHAQNLQPADLPEASAHVRRRTPANATRLTGRSAPA